MLEKKEKNTEKEREK
jgi:hypothetical protein